MPHWVMVVDLGKCIGCGTCKTVCVYANQAPQGNPWRKVSELTLKAPNKVERLFVTLACMHCEAPPCLDVCPSGATYQRNDGPVGIDERLCLGCGACVTACPYQSRVINRSDIAFELKKSEGFTRSGEQLIGICTKCDFCMERISEPLLKDSHKASETLEATPYCAWFCISDALTFGDIQDPESEVSSFLRENRHVVLEEHLGTKPSVYYILPEK